MQSAVSEHLEDLKQLRTLLCSKVTDHFLEMLSEKTYQLMTEKDFKQACKSLSQAFDASSYKTFPLLKDFLAFKGSGSGRCSKYETERQNYCSILNRDLKTTRDLPLWKLEVASKLGLQPEQLPENGSMLTQQQKARLNIPDLEWIKGFFKMIKPMLEPKRMEV
jgi:hypothetical protein